LVVLFSTVFVLAAFSAFIAKDRRLGGDAREAFIDKYLVSYILSLQLIDFTLLSVSIRILFYYLSKYKQVADDKQAFNKERCTLLTILIIFDFSFVVRAAWDIAYAAFLDTDNCSNMILTMNVAVLCDLVPTCCVLYFHATNFTT